MHSKQVIPQFTYEIMMETWNLSCCSWIPHNIKH